MPWSDSLLRKVELNLGVQLPNIEQAFVRSEEAMDQLREVVGTALPDEVSFVAFGSLARKEYTSGSDLDWALVIDGRADSSHRELELDLKRRLTDCGKFKDPNPAGAFGALVFSHELIHCIGGAGDTNANLTRRMLLLLESTDTNHLLPLAPRQRVMRGILERYFEEEAHFPGKPFFPRFFLNDVVRLWRTIAVDYAAKNAERGHEKWALRNAKLRFSRKLLFAAGLLLAFETSLFPDSELIASAPSTFDPDHPALSSTEHCYRAAQLTPLDLIARASMSPATGMDSQQVRRLFEAYDVFLGILDSEGIRVKLAKLSYEEAIREKVFENMREVGHQFQDALNSLFMNPDSELGKLTLKYAIF